MAPPVVPPASPARRDPAPRGGGPGGAALVVSAVALAYATAFRGGFQFDDWPAVVEDGRVRSLAAWWASMPGLRPLLKLGFALDHASGLGLAGFHAVNVLIHAAAAVLALRLLEALGRRCTPAAPPGAALAGALLFALHPVQVEAVTYVSGRSASLSGALALASALAFVRGRERRSPRLEQVLSPLLLAASLAVKETALVLPAALVLLLALEPGFGWRDALREVRAHLAVAAAAVLAFLALAPYRRTLAHAAALRGPLENALDHARAVAWLAGQVLRPWASTADPGLAPDAWADGLLPLAGILALLAACLVALRRWPRARPAAAAGLWFLLWAAPQGWVLPRPELASERQLYLALLGPAALVGLGLARAAAGSPTRRRLAVALGALLAAGLGTFTAARSLDYADEVTFWTDAVAKAPGNPRAQTNLGHALALACRAEEAESAFARALALDPENVRAAGNLRLLREGALQPASCAPARGPDAEK